MKNIILIIDHSSKELKSVRNLVLASLLITIKLILGLFTIPILPTLHLGFTFLPTAAIGFLFGPVVGAMCGLVSDIVGYVINPSGPFFFGFTIVAIVTGIVYGSILYKKKITMKRCFFTVLIITIFINLGLNTIFLAILYKKAFMALLATRLIKNILTIPINTILLKIVLEKVEELQIKYKLK